MTYLLPNNSGKNIAQKKIGKDHHFNLLLLSRIYQWELYSEKEICKNTNPNYNPIVKHPLGSI